MNVHERDHLGLHIPQVDNAACEHWRRCLGGRRTRYAPSRWGCHSPHGSRLLQSAHSRDHVWYRVCMGYCFQLGTFWYRCISSNDHHSTSCCASSLVKTGVDVLWEMDQPVADCEKWPAFPMTLENGRYKVGLLWQSDEHPEDNRAQAFATAGTQLRKLERTEGAKEAYDTVIREYMDLGAVEEELTPDIPRVLSSSSCCGESRIHHDEDAHCVQRLSSTERSEVAERCTGFGTVIASRPSWDADAIQRKTGGDTG